MPTVYDFSHLDDVETVKIKIDGWEEVEIDFAMSVKTSQEQDLYWKVRGTNHTFKNYMSWVLTYYGDNYEKLFSDILTKFRDDYKSWEAVEFEAPWMEEYHEQFDKFIK